LIDLSRVRPDDGPRAVRDYDQARVGQHSGQSVPRGAQWHDAVLGALHYQDRDRNAGEIGAKVFPPRSGTAERGCRGDPDGDVEAVLPGLVARVPRVMNNAHTATLCRDGAVWYPQHDCTRAPLELGRITARILGRVGRAARR
jgi:hypothetical protein